MTPPKKYGCVHHSLSHGLDTPECPICYEPFTSAQPPHNKEPLIRIKACGHYFHKACLELWVDGEGRNTCPSCRQELFRGPATEKDLRQVLDDVYESLFNLHNIADEFPSGDIERMARRARVPSDVLDLIRPEQGHGHHHHHSHTHGPSHTDTPRPSNTHSHDRCRHTARRPQSIRNRDMVATGNAFMMDRSPASSSSSDTQSISSISNGDSVYLTPPGRPVTPVVMSVFDGTAADPSEEILQNLGRHSRTAFPDSETIEL